MFFWPDLDGYPKYDPKHQTAPKIEGDILLFFEFLNMALSLEDSKKVYDSKLVKDRIKYLDDKFLVNSEKFSSIPYRDLIINYKNYYKELERVNIIDTNKAITDFKLNKDKLSDFFLKRDKTVVFHYNSKTFRSDPYSGFVCAYTNLFCTNDSSEKVANLLMVPEGISYKDISKGSKGHFPTFSIMDENLSKCPLFSLKNLKATILDEIKTHLDSCIYCRSKHQRIFGTIPDVIVFKDKVYYNKNE